MPVWRLNITPIRCFVAMAVGRSDTDRIYDKHISPTLKALGIHPIFMGRLEHNDDIDKRIIREIEQCDFAIADLTYARPSVYFEAGFAQRKVPVIYTSRQDHLRPRADDEFGNLRVHFDLLMRNIISWSSPSDSRFAGQLARRIKIVLAPLVRDRESRARVQDDQLQFQRLPLSSRLHLVAEKLREVVKRRGYVPLVTKDEIDPWAGRIPNRYTLNICEIIVQPNFTQRNIKDHTNRMLEMTRSRFEDLSNDEGYNRQMWHNRWPWFKLPQSFETKNVNAVVARLILCSLQRIPRGRVTGVLASATPSDDGNVFSWRGDLDVSYTRHLPMSFSVYIVDPILSVTDASEKSLKLNSIIKAHNAGTPRPEIEASPVQAV